MPEPLPPSEVTVCENQQEHNDIYQKSDSNNEPFFIIDKKDSGYSFTYDLLPTGYRLTEQSYDELDDRVAQESEAILMDENLSTEELARSPGRSMGNFFFFENEETARDFASMVSRIVLDKENWEKEPSPREMAMQDAGIKPDE